MNKYARIENYLIVEVVECDGDIHERFHPDLEFVLVDGSDVEVGYSYKDGVFLPPPPESDEDVERRVRGTLESLKSAAAANVQPLLFAKELGMASDEELELLDKYKVYIVELSRIDKTPQWPNIVEWPVSP